MKATLQRTQGTPQFIQSLKDYRDELLRVKRLAGEYTADDVMPQTPSAPSATKKEVIDGKTYLYIDGQWMEE
jgi:hypothetical protein